MPVSSDFVVALGGLTKAGFALVVRVELDGDSGLVLIGGGLLACLTVLEKHGVGSSRGVCRGFVPLPSLLVYIIRPPCSRLRLFSYLWRLKHNLGSCRPCGAACLEFLRVSSVAPSVGPVFALSVVVAHARRLGVVIIGSSLVAVCLSSSHRLGLRLRCLGCGRLASPSPCVCRIASADWAAACSSLVAFFVLAWRAVPYRLPPRSIRQDGRCDAASTFLRRGGRSHRVLVGVGFWLGFACLFLSMSAGRGLRCGVVAVRTDGLALAVCSLA